MDESQPYKQYSRFRVKLIGDKDFFEVSKQDRDKIIQALKGGAKYIHLGNIFFSASNLASILPVSNKSGKVPYLPNKEPKHLKS